MKRSVALLAAVVLLAGPAWAKDHKPEEIVTVKCTPQEGKPESALLAGLAAKLGDEVIGRIARLAARGGAWLVRKYSDEFDAVYSARYVDDRFFDARIHQCRFTRSLKFKSQQAAREDFPNAIDKIVKTLDLQFQVVTSNDKKTFRVVTQQLDYVASKAQQIEIPFTDKDDLKVGLAYTVRFPVPAEFSTVALSPHVTTTEVKKIDGKPQATGRLKNKSSDWQPAPATGAWSIEVVVTEGSDVKEWLDKLADKLDEFGKS